MKPWARYEVGFINHDKFRAITPNAICLWLEGKNYADAKLTDGLLPDYEVKHWRFHSKKSVALLTRSCGVKPGTEAAYAPLWDIVDGFGFKMHDYLEHNECREIVQERIADGEAVKEAAKAVTRERMARWRALKKAKRDAVVTPSVTPPKRDTERNQRDSDALLQNTDHRIQKTERTRESVPLAHTLTVFDGGLPRDHRDHVFCDPSFTICVPARVHANFIGPLTRRFGDDRQKAHDELLRWYATVAAAQTPDFVMGDRFKFWQLQFDATYATPLAAPTGDEAMWAAIAKKGPSVRP